ncbi:HutD family protein [Bartonella apihabitans]|nr:HutD family protein [Bartonella apihabitans]WLT09037.1 HutD family protein [Bartonella apihabitans]
MKFPDRMVEKPINIKPHLGKRRGDITRKVLLTHGEQGELQRRLSSATMRQSGSSSSFSDIYRSIALLDGDEVTLNITEETSIVLSGSSKPFMFVGEAVVGALPTGAKQQT